MSTVQLPQFLFSIYDHQNFNIPFVIFQLTISHFLTYGLHDTCFSEIPYFIGIPRPCYDGFCAMLQKVINNVVKSGSKWYEVEIFYIILPFESTFNNDIIHRRLWL